MRADDPRHGKYAGAVAHWLHGAPICDPCQRAATKYRKERCLRILEGEQRMVSPLGTIRRFHALQALGWTGPQIAAEAGVSVHTLRSSDYQSKGTIRSSLADAVAAAYERLCMTTPEGGYQDRQRRLARERGWLPPLAWDDIDKPDEKPASVIRRDWHWTAKDDVDPVVVERLLLLTDTPSTTAEKHEAMRQWLAAGKSERALCDAHGWREGRYGRESKEDAA